MRRLRDTLKPRQATIGPATAIGYVRVSTAEQAREGVSLDAQRGRIAAHSISQGLELAAVHADEGISEAEGLEPAGAGGCTKGGLRQPGDARGLLPH